MADGEVSRVIPAAGQYVILKRESLLPADRVRLEEIAPKLEEVLREKKMHAVATNVFDELKKQSSVVVVLDDPARRRQMPGVAAVVNGTQITVRQLAEECIARRGPAVLEDAIGRKLIAQACQKQNVTVTEAELDAEVARVASLMVRPLPDGSPDVNAFLKAVVEKQGMTVDVYRRDAVWPTVALRKLTRAKVQVTEEDVRNGFEANYGPRAKCRVIVLGQLRRAQQVWEMARKHLTADYFGDLAAQYSVEGSSRASRRDAADRQALRPAAVGEGGLRPEAGRDVRRHPVGRQVHHPFLRRIHQAGGGRDGQGPRPDRGGRPRQEAAAGDVGVLRAAPRDRLDRQFPQRKEPVVAATGGRRRRPFAQPPRGGGKPRRIAFASSGNPPRRPLLSPGRPRQAGRSVARRGNVPGSGDFPAPAAFLFPRFPLESESGSARAKARSSRGRGKRRGTISVEKGIAAVDRAMTSEPQKIVAAAKDRLGKDSHLSVQRIWCEFQGGRLVLQGQVPSFYHKQLAQEAVAGLDGVAQVVNEIEVIS